MFSEIFLVYFRCAYGKGEENVDEEKYEESRPKNIWPCSCLKKWEGKRRRSSMNDLKNWSAVSEVARSKAFILVWRCPKWTKMLASCNVVFSKNRDWFSRRSLHSILAKRNERSVIAVIIATLKVDEPLVKSRFFQTSSGTST